MTKETKTPAVTHKKIEAIPPGKIVNSTSHPVVSTTDHAELKAKHKSFVAEDRGGHAVVTVDVPAHQAEISVAHSGIEGCAIAAVEAWEKVKGADDAGFNTMADSYRRELLNAAEGVYRSGVVMKGDTSLARFEQEVARIKGKQDEAKANAAKAA